MKKILTGCLCAILCCMVLAACSDGSTTMDNGRDTDGRAGEKTNSTDTINNPTSGENGEGAQGAAENVTGGAKKAVDNTKDAANNVVDGAGQAVKDVTDGVGNAVKDATNGVTDAVDNMTGKK